MWTMAPSTAMKETTMVCSAHCRCPPHTICGQRRNYGTQNQNCRLSPIPTVNSKVSMATQSTKTMTRTSMSALETMPIAACNNSKDALLHAAYHCTTSLKDNGPTASSKCRHHCGETSTSAAVTWRRCSSSYPASFDRQRTNKSSQRQSQS